MSSTSKSRERIFALTTVSLSVLFVCVFAEITARIYLGEEPGNEGRLFKNREIKLGRSGNEGFASVFFENNCPVVKGLPTNINNCGLRDYRDRKFKKSEGTIRISLFGDSFTFGHGNNDDETLPVQLEALLNPTEVTTGDSIEVLNFGVQGFNSTEAYIYMSRFGMNFDPDIVLFIWLYNDFNKRGYRESDLVELAAGQPIQQTSVTSTAGQGEKRPSQYGFGVSRWLRSNSDFYQYFLAPKLQYVAAKTFGLKGLSGDAYFADFRNSGARLSLNSIKLAAKHCLDRNIRFGVVIYPALQTLSIRFHQDHIYVKLEAFCRKNEIPVLNLFTAVFENRDGSELVVSRRDAHPNGKAQGLAAAAIAKWLSSPALNWL